MSDLQNHLQELKQNPEFSAEYDALDAQYVFARQVISARLKEGMTQTELARRIGTSQANISKLEHGTLNPSFDMARRVAEGLGLKLQISMK
jgi:ribosome-binding protein aMBF1 (putative translation factor)